jgi:hypothetical protein
MNARARGIHMGTTIHITRDTGGNELCSQLSRSILRRCDSHKVTVSKASPVPVPETLWPRLSIAVAVEACFGACIVRRLTCCSGTLVICGERQEMQGKLSCKQVPLRYCFLRGFAARKLITRTLSHRHTECNLYLRPGACCLHPFLQLRKGCEG